MIVNKKYRNPKKMRYLLNKRKAIFAKLRENYRFHREGCNPVVVGRVRSNHNMEVYFYNEKLYNKKLRQLNLVLEHIQSGFVLSTPEPPYEMAVKR